MDKDSKDSILFISSSRGRYLLAQALRIAIKELSTVEPNYMKEVSNIEDMEYMLNSDFLSQSNIMVAVAEEYKNGKENS